MDILLIQRDGIDLHHTLFASETSRMILRFYRPRKKSCGVSISCATLGSALSLVSELRWYIRRYMREALFEWENGIWFTHQLAQDVYYERTAVLGPSWSHRRLYGFREGKLITNLVMSPGSTVGEYQQEYAGVDASVEVWCTEDELGELVEVEEVAEGGEE